MGTDKRERQKAGRQARIEAAQVAAKKAETRRRITIVIAMLGFVALMAIVFVFVSKDRNKDGGESASSSTTGAVTSTTMESAAGKPCVAFSDQLPAGAPDVPIEPGPPPTQLVTKDLVEGTGDPVAPGSTATVNYIGVSCSTGKVFDSSWSRGQPATFPLDQVIKGWGDGIPGMKPGGRRLLIIPPDQAYGPTGRPPAIAPDETLYFVVDLVSALPPGATTTTTTTPPMESAAGKPCVAFSDQLPAGAPDVPIEPGPPPAQLVTKDLVEGTGDPIAPGSTVTVNYIGVSCSTGKIFDSSWSRQQTATFPLDQVIKGWGDGIPGMKPGGRRLLIIPPDQAYGSTGSPPTIAPDETLYFVVDLVGVAAPSTTTTSG